MPTPPRTTPPRYIIIYAQNIALLTTHVNDALEQGYHCIGGIALRSDGGQSCISTFYQAMQKGPS